MMIYLQDDLEVSPPVNVDMISSIGIDTDPMPKFRIKTNIRIRMRTIK